MTSVAASTVAMMQTEKAAACVLLPPWSSRMTVTAATVMDGVTRKMTAESVTIARMNRKKNTETSVGVITGMTASRSAWRLLPPMQVTVSSRLFGTARMPVTIVRKPWEW